ncbi:hypothetical protein F3Y22_tig00111745pilonHSYRG00015 [Hibiscus syriacus]|uniref:Uncharacterized protein n=2 Tax=Hibiscus syriacus TaxID=106335 RepID=A0A6A2YGH2_HIBSY|nr:hypothetical protein F3Y22_tig00111745pilonHSYRG00015 [Hibiscus syriacus]
MGEQRQFLCFRLSWLSSAAAARPVAAAHPAAQTETPSQPKITIPVQQPPFRPAGTVPKQTPPTHAQAPTRKKEPQPVSASRGAIQTLDTSQTRTPSWVPRQARAVSVPPSRIVSQPQSTEQTVSKQRSSSHLTSPPTGQTSPQSSSPSH